MKGCMPSTIKYLLLTVNLLLMLVGLVALGFAVYGYIDGREVAKLVEEGGAAVGENISIGLYSSASIIVIIFCSLVVLISFLGCCGAWKENRFVLFLYFALLLVVFLGTAVGATLTVFQSLDVIKTPLVSSMSKYDPNSQDQDTLKLNAAWDDVQSQFYCCGVNDFSDWANVTDVYPDADDNLVPDSCCAGLGDLDRDNCRKNPEDDEYADRMRGCFSLLQTSISDNKDVIGIVTGTVIVFLFVNLLVVFGFALCLTPHSDYHQV